MLFRQLFDRESSTYTYILADEETREAVIIDPVRDQLDRDLQILEELEVELAWVLETHIHADHVTSSGLLRDRLGARTAVSRRGGADCATMQVTHGDRITFGRHEIEVRATPGHTSGCVTYVAHDVGKAFTGDALLIRGCGRTDFQEGDSETLYDSVHGQIFSLPDRFELYPAHDYKGRTVTTVAEEKRFNPRLGGGRTKAEFVEIMENLNLSYPKKIDVAVPANRQCGLLGQDAEGGTSGGDWAPVVRGPDGVPELAPDWVARHKDEVRLVDVRRQDEWEGELGHVDGAELVTLDVLEEHLGAWDPEAPVVVYCKSGGRSGKAAKLLEGKGFQRVASMAGGMVRWNDESRPISRAPASGQGAPGAAGCG